MKQLTIYQNFFTNTDCYKAGVKQTPKGIQVHSTGANNPYLKRYVQPDDGRLGVNTNKNDHNRAGLDVCANAYIGKLNDGTLAVYQTLPWDYRCWLSGSGAKGNANKLGYIGYEICEDGLNNKAYFEDAVLGLSVILDAYLCQTYNIPVDNIHDHKELCAMGLASNHRDIAHWLEKFGYTMNEYRQKVSEVIQEGVNVVYVNNEEFLYTATVIASSGNTVNLRSSMDTSNDKNIIAKVPIGTKVNVLQNVNATWDRISYNDKNGYMMSKFLKKDTEDEDDIYIKLENVKMELEAALELVKSILEEEK